MTYEIRTRKLQGSPHTVWSIVVAGVVVKAFLHPPSADMIADAINPKIYPMRPYIRHSGTPGRKPKGYRTDNDLEDAA